MAAPKRDDPLQGYEGPLDDDLQEGPLIDRQQAHRMALQKQFKEEEKTLEPGVSDATPKEVRPMLDKVTHSMGVFGLVARESEANLSDEPCGSGSRRSSPRTPTTPVSPAIRGIGGAKKKSPEPIVPKKKSPVASGSKKKKKASGTEEHSEAHEMGALAPQKEDRPAPEALPAGPEAAQPLLSEHGEPSQEENHPDPEVPQPGPTAQGYHSVPDQESEMPGGGRGGRNRWNRSCPFLRWPATLSEWIMAVAFGVVLLVAVIVIIIIGIRYWKEDNSNNICHPSRLPDPMDSTQWKDHFEKTFIGNNTWIYPCKNAVDYNLGFMRSLYDMMEDSQRDYLNATEFGHKSMQITNFTAKFVLAYAMVSNNTYLDARSVSHGFEDGLHYYFCTKLTRAEPELSMLNNTHLCSQAANARYNDHTDLDYIVRFQKRLLAMALLFGEFRDNLAVLNSTDTEAVAEWASFYKLAMHERRAAVFMDVGHPDDKEKPLDRAVVIQLNKFNEARSRMMKNSPENGQTWKDYCHSVAGDLGL